MKLEGIMLSEIKSEREWKIQYDLTYMWNVKTKQNKMKMDS